MTMNLILVQAEILKKTQVYCNSTVMEITSPFILNIFKFVKNVTNLFIYFLPGAEIQLYSYRLEVMVMIFCFTLIQAFSLNLTAR